MVAGSSTVMSQLMKKVFRAGILVSLLAMSACQKRAAAPGGVAVIDLDRVATAMGWMEEMSKTIQATDADLKTQLNEVLRNTLRSIDDTKKQVAAEAKLTAEQIKVFNSAKD